MKRFDRLELGELEQQQQDVTGKHRPGDERDERHWLRVAEGERRNGLHESALRLYSRALEVDKSCVDGWVGQVQMLIALGEYPEAELWARKALELFKSNARLLAGHAQALCRRGDLKTAQASCDAAIGQQGLDAYPWLARGELMLARHETIEEYCFDKAVQLDGDWLILVEIGDVYLHHRKPAKALGRVRQAVERAADQSYPWYRQGVCELALGLTTAAQRSFGTCLQLMPNHAGARDALHTLTMNRRPVRNWIRRFFRIG